ncbi:MAG: transposase [Bacteroidales bacterium]
MNKSRRKHSAAFKAELAIAAIKERETLSELSSRYGIHPTVISTWKNEFLKRSEELFSKSVTRNEADFEKERQELYAKIGEIEMQRDWLKKSRNNWDWNNGTSRSCFER